MGKLTISMAMFNSKQLNYQRVFLLFDIFLASGALRSYELSCLVDVYDISLQCGDIPQ